MSLITRALEAAEEAERERQAERAKKAEGRLRVLKHQVRTYFGEDVARHIKPYGASYPYVSVIVPGEDNEPGIIFSSPEGMTFEARVEGAPRTSATMCYDLKQLGEIIQNQVDYLSPLHDEGDHA